MTQRYMGNQHSSLLTLLVLFQDDVSAGKESAQVKDVEQVFARPPHHLRASGGDWQRSGVSVNHLWGW